jgi:hypothetical protein
MTRSELADELERVCKESNLGREDVIRAIMVARSRVPRIKIEMPSRGDRKPLNRPYGGFGAKQKKGRASD